MNVQINYNGTNITTYTLEYTRAQHICTGIGLLEFSTIRNLPITLSPWDEVVLYESGVKKGTYIVDEYEDSANGGKITVRCTDYSKKLQDYFISDSYNLGYISSARYWIEKFLTEAGVNYTITATGSGAPIAEETSLGMASAYDMIMTLMSQSGWYMYFNQNGVAIIGSLETSLANPTKSFNCSDILSVADNKDDQMLRNRAVVWGKGDPNTNSWIFSDLSIQTPWNYDSVDKRTVVLANSDIADFATANSLANTMLDEFARITRTRTIVLVGAHNVKIGDIVFIKCKYGKGIGLITTISSTVSASNGLQTTIVLDERCPRLFGYVGYGLDYIYAGTTTVGVRRKLLEGSTWEDYSTGLGDLGIKDLYVENGILAAVTNSGILYLRDVSLSSWFPVIPSDLTDLSDSSTVSTINLKAQAVTINSETNNVYCIYNYNNRAWIIEYDGSGTQLDYSQIVINNDYGLDSIDIDTNNKDILTTVKHGTSYPAINFGDRLTFSSDDIFTTNNLDNYTREWNSGLVKRTSNTIHYDNKVYWVEQSYSTPTQMRLVHVEHSSTPLVWTYSNYVSIEGYVSASSNYLYHLFQHSDTLFYMITYNETTGNYNKYEYDVNTNTLTHLHAISFGFTPYLKNKNILFAGDVTSDQIVIQTYDLYSENYNIQYPESQTGYSYSTWTTDQRNPGNRLMFGAMQKGTVFGVIHLYKNSGNYTAVLNCGFLDVNGNFNYNIVPLNGSGAGGTINGPNIALFGSSPYDSVSCYMWCKVFLDGISYYTLIDVITGTIFTTDGDTSSAYWGSITTTSYNQAVIWHWDSSIFASLTDTLGSAFLMDQNINYLEGALTRLSSKIDFLTNHMYSHYVPSTVGFFAVVKKALGASSISITLSAGINTSFGDYFIEAHFGENVFSIQYHDGGDNGNYLYFYEFGTYIPPSVGGYKTLLKNNDSYVVLDNTSSAHKVEISTSYPVVTFAAPSGFVPSGVAANVNTFDAIRVLYNITPSGDSLATTLSGYSVDDCRVVNLYQDVPITISGLPYTPSGSAYLFASISGLGGYITSILPIDNTWTPLVTLAGWDGRVETTNFFNPPYFFISNTPSGIIASGILESGISTSGSFFQRYSTGTEFIDYSTGIDDTQITILRVDDRL